MGKKLNVVNQQYLATVLKSLFGEHHIITNARKWGNVRVPQNITNIKSTDDLHNVEHYEEAETYTKTTHPHAKGDFEETVNKINLGMADTTGTKTHLTSERPRGGTYHDPRPNSNIDSSNSGHYLELDFWIPAIRLAFEYQDPHHYISTYYANASIQDIQHNDKLKKEIMESRGDNLIIVPCWWQGDVDSLVTTIRNIRYDLLTDIPIVSSPIPTIPPDGYFKVLGVPGVGELMVPSFPRVAQFSIVGWWISEKYDGVRVCWHGSRRKIYSRYGRPVLLPSFVVHTLPPGIFLDMEAWAGRGGFNSIQTIMDPQEDNDVNESQWSFFRMLIFDTPDPKLASLGYEKRMNEIFAIVPSDSPILVIASNLKSKKETDLPTLTGSMLQHEGEGIIARKPLSSYHPGLSDTLWKFKGSRDMEALVIEEVAEDGYFTLKLANEIVIKAQIKNGITAPDIGQVVSLSYSKYSPTLGPINPVIERVRSDIEWDEVVSNDQRIFFQDTATSSSGFKQQKSEGIHVTRSDKLHAGYWTEPENVKQFFESIALKYNFDTNDPAPWYNYTIKDIISEGGGSMLARYSQSPLRALQTAYPHLDFIPYMFAHVPKHYWSSPENRRQFLHHFAQKKGFDALVPTHWYTVTVQEIIDVKGGAIVLAHHDNSLAKTLCDLFPNIGLNQSLFKTPRGYFTSITAQRNFLENFANKMGFNPLKASGWRNVTKAEILSEPGGPTIINKYKTLTYALTRLFPELSSQALKDTHPRKYWNDLTNRKAYFETIAKQRKFNPLTAESWYSINLQTYVRHKGYKSILNFHNGSIASALLQCYPNIGLDLDRLELSLVVRR